MYVTALFSPLPLTLHAQAINPSGKTYNTALKFGWQEVCMLDHVTVYIGKSFSRIRKENRKIRLYSKTNDASWVREKLK